LLPYEDGLLFERVLSYPVDQVNVMLPQGGVSLTGENFTADNPRQLQDGRTVDVFTIADVPSGQPFAFELDGQPEFEGQFEINSISSTPPKALDQQAMGQILLIAGLAMLGLVVIGGGVWQWRQGMIESENPALDKLMLDPKTASEVALIRTIAELDNEYLAGDLTEENYLSRRGDLRVELNALLAEHQSAPEPVENFDKQSVETNVENSKEIL
jgi:hypothetical protein